MKRGFSIVEFLVYIGLLGGVMVILFNILVTTIDTQLQTQAYSSVELDGRYILSRISYDLRRASVISSPSQNGTSSTTLTAVIGGLSYSYSVSGGVLQLTSPTGTYSLTGHDTFISNFQSTRIGNSGGNPSIQINFTLTSITSDTTGNQNQKNYQTTVSLR